MLLDTHCHLTDARYRGELSGVLERAAGAGVSGVIAIASDLRDAERVRALLTESAAPGGGGARIWGTAGVHPHEAAKAPADFRERLREALAHPEVVAVGECGLDFHYDFSPRDSQRRVFDEHIEVASELDLPLVVHCREAEEEMTERVLEAGKAGVRGVLHCFPGDPGLLTAALDAGWLVSFTGLVTFKSFDGVEAVRNVPADRYMLETDGPYMAPVPYRGKRNEPAFLPLIRDRMAELRGEAPEKVECDTSETACRFFRLPHANEGA
ncbi:MAG: TatD family hydrolase [Gemmatimonadota bacterium]